MSSWCFANLVTLILFYLLCSIKSCIQTLIATWVKVSHFWPKQWNKHMCRCQFWVKSGLTKFLRVEMWLWCGWQLVFVLNEGGECGLALKPSLICCLDSSGSVWKTYWLCNDVGHWVIFLAVSIFLYNSVLCSHLVTSQVSFLAIKTLFLFGSEAQTIFWPCLKVFQLLLLLAMDCCLGVEVI